jgi:hypothetical protein
MTTATNETQTIDDAFASAKAIAPAGYYPDPSAPFCVCGPDGVTLASELTLAQLDKWWRQNEEAWEASGHSFNTVFVRPLTKI